MIGDLTRVNGQSGDVCRVDIFLFSSSYCELGKRKCTISMDEDACGRSKFSASIYYSAQKSVKLGNAALLAN
jgi:hypothetical protein